VTFEVLSGDLIQRAGRNLGGGDAQFFGFDQNFFVLDPQLLCNVVNTDGHMNLFPTNCKLSSSWSDDAKITTVVVTVIHFHH
jgi:hypothetical protein